MGKLYWYCRTFIGRSGSDIVKVKLIELEEIIVESNHNIFIYAAEIEKSD